MSGINFKLYTSIFIFFCSSFTFSQKIHGTVFNENENPVTAKILIKNPSNLAVISEFFLAPNGKFEYNLKKSYASNGFVLEVAATGYTTLEAVIKPSGLKPELKFKFVLKKEKLQKLDEVVVEGKRPFRIKKDTLVFNVESYSDGTEKKVEDLLKKLPGIEINEANGFIKFRGKSIETVTIEGDNLFNYNYSIGTKNINIDLITEIEAIENYSENKLLKGIESSEKVSLNLKLKENKVDITGNSDIGVGDFPDNGETPLNVSLNLLGINKSYKSFAVGSFNNIGENASPFDYYGNSINLEQMKDQKYYSHKAISEFTFPQVTRTNLTNINNQFFGNFNAIFNISDKVKIKTNLYTLSDKIDGNQFLESTIFSKNNRFTIFDNYFIQKKPLQHRGDLALTINTSASSLIEYDVSLRDEVINTSNTIFSNQANDFESVLDSKSLLLKQNLQYTKKITDSTAVQMTLLNATNNLAQDYEISPSTMDNSEFDNDVQNNDSRKLVTSFKTEYLGRGKQNNKYNIAFGFNLDKESFNSNLQNQDIDQGLKVNNSSNNLRFHKNEIFTQGGYNWRLGKFIFSPNFSLKYLYQKLNQEDVLMDSKNLLFEPSVSLIYKLNTTSILNFRSGFNQNTQDNLNLFSNEVLINNRLVRKNIANISLQKSQNYSVSFSKNDLFNQLELSFGGSYIKQNGNYFNETEIDENTTKLTNFFLPENTENIDFYLNFSKLLSRIKTNFKITSSYSIYNFKNIINNSNLTLNKSSFFNNSLSLRTAFNSSINFENNTTFLFQQNKGQSTFANNSLNNHFKIKIKPSKQFIGTITYNYFIPNLSDNRNTYSFLSSKILFKPKNKAWQLDFSGVNLLNENFYSEESISEISTDIFRVNLLNRYYMLNFAYSF
ncbi:carboxypeptidase-like regulatory domain-containing protein [Flavobacterium sp. ASW18X]|uniref:carboxypeptidase-like regulatory domain-containing protein n=1 Tax=Flavobacterium sp. ASW18X TaxID=2572595 RepID=UPI0010AEB516|nr:carboxypeptidase-like regulatory domain-containing protein [Flavobacterium sp. ASW18X]TKD61013.1 carboxypeptidase-like regulatory domain-containing protein [Flavobacterium sp. ASW18X]